MSPSPDIIYEDMRFGDRYEIELDVLGDFVHAMRYVDRVGSDPIVYDRLHDIPQPHQHAIEQKIWQKRRTSLRG